MRRTGGALYTGETVSIPPSVPVALPPCLRALMRRARPLPPLCYGRAPLPVQPIVRALMYLSPEPDRIQTLHGPCAVTLITTPLLTPSISSQAVSMQGSGGPFLL